MWTLFQLLKCQASRMVAFPVLPEESREALVALGYQQRHPHSYLSHTHNTHMHGAALLLPPPLGLSKVQQLRLAGLMGWRGCWFYRDVTKRVEQRAENSGVGGMSQGVEGCLVITGPCCGFSAFFTSSFFYTLPPLICFVTTVVPSPPFTDLPTLHVIER